MGLLGTILLDIVSFILMWIFVSLAIHVTAALIGTRKGFGKALLMSLVLAVIFIAVFMFLPAYWWLTLILYFVIMMIAFIETYDMKAGQAFAAAIIVVVIAILLYLLIIFSLAVLFAVL
ncbi:MAG TPA: hypothetical protein VKK79_06790 [Candidatus Lokiarchaeia archaeon]|nr:hypothetical protein [Candidatus Lokiarchaeia archaeon]